MEIVFETFLAGRPEEIRDLRTAYSIAEAGRAAGLSVTQGDVEAAFQRRSRLAQTARRRGLIRLLPKGPKLRDPAKWAIAAAVDLSPIAWQMISEHGWTAGQAGRVMEDYRRYFYLAATQRPQESVAPTVEIDEFWHRHVLNTRRYFADCHSLHGGYIHHEVPAGPGSGGTLAFCQTILRWETEFGTPYPSEETLGGALLDRPRQDIEHQ